MNQNRCIVSKKWDPFEDWMGLTKALTSLGSHGLLENDYGRNWTVPIDVVESKDHFTVKVEVPGIDPKEIKLSVEDDLLTIQGERQQETNTQEDQVFRSEMIYGAFMRQVRLPKTVLADKVEADYKNGILNIRIPKGESSKKRWIPIQFGK